MHQSYRKAKCPKYLRIANNSCKKKGRKKDKIKVKVCSAVISQKSLGCVITKFYLLVCILYNALRNLNQWNSLKSVTLRNGFT